MLAGLPSRRVAGVRLHRIFQRRRGSPWWFSSAGDDAVGGNRFDLAAPGGSCYLGTSAASALLEAFQGFGQGLLPDLELRWRRRAEVVAPPSAPRAAQLTAAAARGRGVTAALWSGGTRALTQQWATSLYRAGWRAVYHGIQHDPTASLRAITLFDKAGEHAPFDDPAWDHLATSDLHDDPQVAATLSRYGIRVIRSDVQLPVVALATVLPTGPSRRRHH